MIVRRGIAYILLLACSMHVAFAKEVTKTTMYSLGGLLKKNSKKAFTITRALYGNIVSGKYTDVTKQLDEHAQKGVLYIPHDMRKDFAHDPAPGEVKSLDITFKVGNKTYELDVPELWTIPAWYNFKQEETTQTMITRTPYIQAESCTLEDLFILLKANNEAPFRIISGQYGKLNTQKIVDVTRKLNAFSMAGAFMLPEDIVQFCKKDPAPDAEKKMKIVFELGDRWYQLQVGDNWQMPATRSLDDEGTRDLIITRSSHDDFVFLKIPYNPGMMKRFENVIKQNNGTPFTILDAFVVQPWFRGTEQDMSYDVTGTLQVQADTGCLCLPQNLRALIGNQGTLPYMYVIKISFVMNAKTYALTYRDNFASIEQPKYSGKLEDMLAAISPFCNISSMT